MLDKLKSIFIIEDEEDNKSKESDPKSTGKTQQGTVKKSTPASKSPASPSPGKVKARFTEVLLKAMEANNLDGFDYLEFKHSLKSLEKMPMDERTRFQSAFAMAQTMGASPDHLIKTADHYIRVLLEENEKFSQALANQRSRQIGDKEDQIKQLDSVIKEKTSKIEELKTEIALHGKKMEKLKGEISSAVVKVESTKNDFRASFNFLVNKIKKDIDHMKSYLK